MNDKKCSEKFKIDLFLIKHRDCYNKIRKKKSEANII